MGNKKKLVSRRSVNHQFPDCEVLNRHGYLLNQRFPTGAPRRKNKKYTNTEKLSHHLPLHKDLKDKDEHFWEKSEKIFVLF